MIVGDALLGVEVDDLSHLHVAHIKLDGERSRVLHRVEEDGGDLRPEADAARALVGHVRDVLAHEPQHRVGGALAGGASADHIAYIGEGETLLLQRLHLLDRPDSPVLVRLDTLARQLQHSETVQRDIGTAPRVGSGRKIVGVGLSLDEEDGGGDLIRDIRPREKPLSLRPALHHLRGERVASLRLLLDVKEGIKHEQHVLKTLRSDGAKLLVVEKIHQSRHVVPSLHGAKQLGSQLGVHDGALGLASGDGGEKASLDIRSLVHTRGHAVGDEVDHEVLLALGGVLEELDEISALLRVEGLGHDAHGSALSNKLVVLGLEGGGEADTLRGRAAGCRSHGDHRSERALGSEGGAVAHPAHLHFRRGGKGRGRRGARDARLGAASHPLGDSCAEHHCHRPDSVTRLLQEA
mmetsp:Transcript_7519/g.14716  ORF Transcript_7519/g.14716 Transcript_7519/m.14716 type:complete len:408 (-) Transcript_7519:24-1247(-)